MSATIQIYAGEDEARARQNFSQAVAKLKSEGVRVISFANVSSIDPGLDLTSSLFGERCVYVIESLSSKKADVTLVKELLTNGIEILAYAGSSLARELKFAWGETAKIHYSTLQVDIFVLLDSIGVLPKKQVIANLATLAQTADENFLYQMLSKRFVELYFASEKAFDSKLAPWQKAKLSKQVTNFSTSQLQKITSAFYRLELRLRTASSPLPLLSELNLLLLFYLK